MAQRSVARATAKSAMRKPKAVAKTAPQRPRSHLRWKRGTLGDVLVSSSEVEEVFPFDETNTDDLSKIAMGKSLAGKL